MKNSSAWIASGLLCLSLGTMHAQAKSRVAPAGAPAIPRSSTTKFVLVGDSTVATGGGWGPGFCALVAPGVQCVDLALNGRSTKSYLDEGSWEKALAAKGSVYLIQFGHNDEKLRPELHTDPGSTFYANLQRFVRDVEAQGGVVVLLSPLARRTFVDGHPSNPTLRAYGDATKRVAAEEHVPYLDLLTLSEALLAKGNQAEADAFDALAHADAKAENSDKARPALDRTHLNPLGQQIFGEMVVRALISAQPQLAPAFQAIRQ